LQSSLPVEATASHQQKGRGFYPARTQTRLTKEASVKTMVTQSTHPKRIPSQQGQLGWSARKNGLFLSTWTTVLVIQRLEKHYLCQTKLEREARRAELECLNFRHNLDTRAASAVAFVTFEPERRG
jgi:hypothetical protein